MLAAARLGKLGLGLDTHQQQQPLVAARVHADRNPDHDAPIDDADDATRHDNDAHHPAEHAQRPARRLRLDRPLDLGCELTARAPDRV
jgi:hypothetical protein